MRVLKLVAVPVVALLLACGDPFAPVGRVERFTPSSTYRDWYAEVATCAGRTGNFDAITWEVADSLRSPTPGYGTWAEWVAPHTIRVRRDFLTVEAVVKHEELHDLLQSPDHPSPPFALCDTAP